MTSGDLSLLVWFLFRFIWMLSVKKAIVIPFSKQQGRSLGLAFTPCAAKLPCLSEPQFLYLWGTANIFPDFVVLHKAVGFEEGNI